MFEVSRSFESERPRTSMMFERFALKRPSVYYYVSLSLMCSFSMKFIGEVLNSYVIIFELETLVKITARTNQGSLRKEPSFEPKAV